jgi:hypothetical protein
MTALQNQFNQLLVDQAKLRESERANRASEQIRSREASASERHAEAAKSQAATAAAKFTFGKEGPLGILNDFLGNILKSLGGGGK